MLREIESQTYLKIESKPPGAAVRVDDKPAGSTSATRPLAAKVGAGPHNLQLTLEGYKLWTRRVDVKDGETLPVRAELELKPKPVVAAEIKFSATLETIQPGQSTKLSWDTQNATEVSIEPDIGNVLQKGTQDVAPRKTTTYTISAKWSGGEEKNLC